MVLHFHKCVRPELRNHFARVPWLDLADLASEVEVRLILSLSREIDRTRAFATWGETKAPSYGQMLSRWLKCDRQPELKQRRALAGLCISPSFYRTCLGDELADRDPDSAQIDPRAAVRIARFYLGHTNRPDLGDRLECNDELIASHTKYRIVTLEQARLAISSEVQIDRKRSREQGLSFPTEKSWIGFCVRVARNVYNDLFRKRKRERLNYCQPGELTANDRAAAAE